MYELKNYVITGNSWLRCFCEKAYNIILLSLQVVSAIVMNIFSACGGVVIFCFAIIDIDINQLCTAQSLTTTTIEPNITTWSWDELTTSTTIDISTTWDGRETTVFDYRHWKNCLVCNPQHLLLILTTCGIGF